jgi:hypothetical protein
MGIFGKFESPHKAREDDHIGILVVKNAFQIRPLRRLLTATRLRVPAN